MRTSVITLCYLLATTNYYGTNVTAGKANLSSPPNLDLTHLSSPPNTDVNLYHPSVVLASASSSTAESTVDDLHLQQQAVVLPPNVLTEKEDEDTTIVKGTRDDATQVKASATHPRRKRRLRLRRERTKVVTSLHDDTSAKMIADATYSKDSATPAAVEDGATREDATLVKASTTHPRRKRRLRLRRDHTKTQSRRGVQVMSMSTQLTPITQFIFDFKTASKVAEITSKIFAASNGRINISTSEAMGAFVMEEELEPAFWHGHLDHWTKCIAIIRVLDKVHFSYDLEGEFGHLICGDSDSPTLSPINSDSNSSTLSPSNSPSLASTTIKQFYTGAIVVLKKSRRMLLDHHERSLQLTSICGAVLKATFDELFANAGTDVTDVAVASFSQDSSGNSLTVEFTATVDVACESAKCKETSTDEVNQVIEDAISSPTTFEAALAANLEGKDCPELDGVTLVSADATVCTEPGFCDLSDPATCDVGDICLFQTGICPLSTCVGAPTLSPSVGPSLSPTTTSVPSLSPSLSPTTTSVPSLSPSLSPTTTSMPSLSPSLSPTTTSVPSLSPSLSPTTTSMPSLSPSLSPTTTRVPSLSPSLSPTTTSMPSLSPSLSPTTTSVPSISGNPSAVPTCSKCDGNQACTNQGSDSDVTIECGSCIERQSCDLLGGASGSANVGKQSCVGAVSCQQAGYDGNADIGNDSCDGFKSCQSAGGQSGSATIGNGSCNGEQSCRLAGYNGGSATIGDGSCNGTDACVYAGNAGSVTINEGSCNGDFSCQAAGYQGSVTIGEGSCKAYKACAGKGFLSNAVVIGNNECNNPCECCVAYSNFGITCDCGTKCDLVNGTAVPPLYENCTEF